MDTVATTILGGFAATTRSDIGASAPSSEGEFVFKTKLPHILIYVVVLYRIKIES